MQLFKNNRGILTPIEKDSFKLERDIQSLVEENMEVLFGLELICSEFPAAGFKLDSLAFDEQNNAFIIIEYKRGHSYSVIDQGLSYLSAMLDYKDKFIVEYNERKGQQLRRDDIDWTSSRVIFIAPSFNKFQKSCINFKDILIELWEINQFEDGTIVLEQCISNSNESIEKLSRSDSYTTIFKVSEQVKLPSEDNHIQKLSKELRPLWNSLKERLEEYPDISFSSQKLYMSCKREGTSLCLIHFRKTGFGIQVQKGTINKEGERSKGYFTLDDPKELAKDRSWTWQNGNKGNAYWIDLKKPEQLDYVMFLLKQKYNSMN